MELGEVCLEAVSVGGVADDLVNGTFQVNQTIVSSQGRIVEFQRDEMTVNAAPFDCGGNGHDKLIVFIDFNCHYTFGARVVRPFPGDTLILVQFEEHVSLWFDIGRIVVHCCLAGLRVTLRGF